MSKKCSVPDCCNDEISGDEIVTLSCDGNDITICQSCYYDLIDTIKKPINRGVILSQYSRNAKKELRIEDNKYKMFKNFMSNEMGITKEDIQNWVKESVKLEAKKVVDKTFENFDINKFARHLLVDEDIYGGKNLKYEVRKSITDLIISKVQVSIPIEKGV